MSRASSVELPQAIEPATVAGVSMSRAAATAQTTATRRNIAVSRMIYPLGVMAIECLLDVETEELSQGVQIHSVNQVVLRGPD